MFTFTPLLGAQAESQAVQSLLEFDGGVRILVDVGWDETFDARQLQELERWVIKMLPYEISIHLFQAQYLYRRSNRTTSPP